MTTTTENTEVKKNLDWAVKVLEDLTNFMDVEEALAIVRREKPDHEILENFKGADAQDLAGKEIAKERAAKNLAAARADEDYEKLRQIGDILGNDDIKAEADDLYIEKNKEELEKNGLNDDEALLVSWRKLEKETSGISRADLEDDEELKEMLGATRLYDDVDKDGEPSATENDDWAAFLESVRKDVTIKMHDNKEFFFKKGTERKADLIAEMKNTFKAKLAVAVAASSAKPFMQKLKDITPAKVSAWLKGLATGKFLRDADGKAVIWKSQLMNSTVQTAVNLKNHQKEMEKRGFTKTAAAVEKTSTGFFNKMKEWGKKAWEMRYAVADSIANNKNRIITTAAVGVATAIASPALLALGAGATVAAGVPALSYALYNVAGAYIWPLEEQRMKLRRAALKAGDAKTAANYKFGWKNYFSKIWDMKAEMTEEQRARYHTRAAVTAGVGVLGAGLIGYGTLKVAENAGSAAVEVGKVLGIHKFWARTMRALGSSSVSGWFAAKDTVKAIKTGDEQAKKNAVVAWIGAAGTALISAVAQVIDYERSVAGNANVDADPNGGKPADKLAGGANPNDSIPAKGANPNDSIPAKGANPNDSIPAKGANPNDSIPAKGANPNDADNADGGDKSKGSNGTEPVDGETKVRTIEVPEGSGRMVESPIEFPKEYDAEFCEKYGLTKTEWNRLVRIHHDDLEKRFALFNEFFTKKVPGVIEEKDMMEEFRKFTVQEDHHTFIWEKENNKEWRAAMIAIHNYVICEDEAEPVKDLNYNGVFAAVTDKNAIVGEKGTWNRINTGVDCDRAHSKRIGGIRKIVQTPKKENDSITIEEQNEKKPSAPKSDTLDEVNTKKKTAPASFSLDDVNEKKKDAPMQIEAYEEGGTTMNGQGVHPDQIHPEKGSHVTKGSRVIFTADKGRGGSRNV